MLTAILLKIDLFGTPVSMNFAKKRKIRSDFGGLCSLLYFCFIVWTIYYGSRDFFAKRNPRSISSEVFNENPRELVLSPNTFPFGFGLQAPNTLSYQPFINESIYTIRVFHRHILKVVYENGTEDRQWMDTNLTTEICTREHFGSFISIFETIQLGDLYCIARNQPAFEGISIEGTYGSPVYQMLLFQVLQCNNQTSSVPCASQEIIDAYLSGAWFNIAYANIVVDPNNYTSPDRRFQEFYSTMVSPTNYKESVIELGYLEVITDSGWLLEDVTTQNYIKANKVTESLHNYPDPEKMLMTFSFQVSMLENYSRRIFKKVQDILAEVGGLANAAFVILLILVTPYSNLKFREALTNEIFDMKMPDKQNRQIVKKFQKYNTEKGDSTLNQNNQLEDKMNNSIREVGSEYSIDNKKLESFVRRLSASAISFNNPKINLESRFEKSSPNSPFSATTTARFSRLKNDEKEALNISPTSEEKLRIPKNKSIRSRIRSEMNRPTYDMGNADNTENMGFQEISFNTLKYSNIDNERTSENLIQKGKNEFQRTRIRSMELDNRKAKQGTSITFNITTIDQKEKSKDTEVDTKAITKIDEEKGESLTVKDTLDNPSKFNSQIDYCSERKNSPLEEDLLDDSFNSTKKKSEKIILSIWEYIISFFYRPQRLKHKLELLGQAITQVDERLNVINVMKKLRELDKLKALLLDNDERILFNNLPNPEIKVKSLQTISRKLSNQRKDLKRTTFIERTATKDQVFQSLKKLQIKPKKTKISRKMLQIFTNRED